MSSFLNIFFICFNRTFTIVGGKLLPKTCSTHDGSPIEETFESLVTEKSRTPEEEYASVAESSSTAIPLGNDEAFTEIEGEEDARDSTVVPAAAASTSTSIGILPYNFEYHDSETDDALDDILDRGRNMLKKGHPLPKNADMSGYVMLNTCQNLTMICLYKVLK